jgi:UDP-glucose 4-epimerase
MKNIMEIDSLSQIIVLGNSGFIGSNLGNFLREQSSGIKLRGYSSSDLNLLDRDEVMKFGDVIDEKTAIVMCSMVKKEFGDSIETFSQNMEMALNLCRAIENNPVKRFIYLSSTSVYGEEVHNTEISEQTLPRPTSYYGLAKYASEHLFRKVIGQQERGSLLILRPPLIYGAGDRSAAYGPAGFIQKAINFKMITLWGDGSERREFIYIDDFIKIVADFLWSDRVGVVNVVSGTNYCFKDVLDEIVGNMEVSLRVEIRERSKKKVDHGFRNEVFKKSLPDFSFTTLGEGIRKTIVRELSLTK